jgi:nondiscriminating aspartyl-tRNA synthetase
MSQRTLIRELSDHVGNTVVIEGWLHKRRLLGGLNFFVLRDRSGIAQFLVEAKDEVEKLRGLQVGTVLKVKGHVISDERAPGGIEVHDPELTVIVPVTEEPIIEIDKPLSHKSEHLDTLLDTRAIGLRNLHEQSIFRARADVNRLIRSFLTEREFIEIQTPKLLAGATEGGAEVFELDYFGKEATLAQSPQFYKQMMVGVFERVFEIAPAYRAEPSATTRHMTELTMLDIEMGFIESHDDVLHILEELVYSVTTDIYKSYAADLKRWNAPELKLTRQFPRFTVAEVHELYTQATKTDTTGEKDLTPDEERWICEFAKKQHGSEAVFITQFPIETHKFYQKINPDDPTTVLCADLLFRGIEIATAPVREHEHNKLVAQMKAKGLNPDEPGFKYYLQAFEYGLPPHGGCGFGIDRFVEKIFNLGNVKEATLFPRDINRLTP